MSRPESGCVCPACGAPIPFKTVFFAVAPIWIRCPACRAKLTGNWLVHLVAVSVAFLAAAGAVAVMVWTWDARPPLWQTVAALAGLVVVLGVVIAFPVTRLALRHGRYRRRD